MSESIFREIGLSAKYLDVDFDEQEKKANIFMAVFFIVVIMAVVIYNVFTNESKNEQEQPEPTATIEATTDVEVTE